MSNIHDVERVTQNRVVKLIKEKLGYTYLGDWSDRANNKNIEVTYLTKWLTDRGVNKTLITKTLRELEIGRAHV